MQNDIGTLDFLPGARNADAFDGVIGFPQAGRVHNMQRHAVDMDLLHHFVACRSGDRRDDGDIVASQRVEQAGFADVGLARQNDMQAFAQDHALARLRDQRGKIRGQRIQRRAGLIFLKKVDFLFGKVQCRFDQHAQMDDAVRQVVHTRREFA
ncbi:hypothetical protein D3C72_1555500 [compost metagenome]